MSEIEKIRRLEGAVVDLLLAIQGGNWEPAEELEVVKEALYKYPQWRVEIHPLEKSVHTEDSQRKEKGGSEIHLSTTYTKLIITETSKDIGSKEDYQIFNHYEKTFESTREASEWLKETYENHKREKMYVDDKQGNTHHIGFIFGFRNQDISHNSKWWLQRDWVEMREVNETPVDMGHILKEEQVK